MELRRQPMLAALSASVRSMYLTAPATNMTIAGLMRRTPAGCDLR